MHLDLTLPALGCAVLHSLWELALIGTAAWLGLRFTTGRSATFRYGLALGFFGLMLVVPLLTLAHFGRDRVSAQTLVWVEAARPSAPATVIPAKAFTVVPGVGVVSGAHAWIGSLSTWSARLWMLGALFMSLRLLWMWIRERSAFHRDLEALDETWALRFSELCQRMRIGRRVSLRVSRRASSPMTWGWLWPIVLLPASSLLHLSPEALEAVLIHELAHVRRLDYLAGLVQSLVEVLLFYHPAVWWLSRQIRELREHCCDDTVMEMQGDPLDYAEALTTLERLRRQELPRLVQASQQGNLMFRIKRMLNPEIIRPLKLNALAIPLVAGLAGGLVFTASRTATAATATSQSAVFSYSTGAVKALRIEGFDPEWAKPFVAPIDHANQAAYDASYQATQKSWSQVFDWAQAQIQLRLEAIKRGEKIGAGSYEAPTNDAQGRPQGIPLMRWDMVRKTRLVAIHAPVAGQAGALTFHLESLEGCTSLTPEKEKAVLEEALVVLKEAQGKMGLYGNVSTDLTGRFKAAPKPVVDLPVPKTGTAFLISTGDTPGLRLVGFEALLPARSFIPEEEGKPTSPDSDKAVAQLKTIESWALVQIQERLKALHAGVTNPWIPYTERPLSVTGYPQDESIAQCGDADALGHGRSGKMLSLHPGEGGQRMSLAFRSSSMNAFKGRKPTPLEEEQLLTEIASQLDGYLRGRFAELSVAKPSKTHPGTVIGTGWAQAVGGTK